MKLKIRPPECFLSLSRALSGINPNVVIPAATPIDSGTIYSDPTNKKRTILKCTPNIGRISICLDGMSSVLYRAHVV